MRLADDLKIGTDSLSLTSNDVWVVDRAGSPLIFPS